MRGDNVALGRGRGPVPLVAFGALLLTAGFLLLLASLVLRTADKHSSFGSLTSAGAILAVAGVAFGLVTLTLFWLAKAVTGRRRSDHNDAGYPVQAAAIPPGTWPSAGQFSPAQHPVGPPAGVPNAWRPAPGPARARTGGFPAAPSAPKANGYQFPPPGFGGDPGRRQQPRPFVPPPPAAAERRAAPLDPTSVYSPGGLIGPPSRDERRDDGPVTPGHEFGSWGAEQPDGPEYAEVLHQEPQRPARDVPLMPVAPPEPAAMFVYRDSGDATEEKPRGPFEPLVKSAGEATLDDGATAVGDYPA